MTRAVTVVAGVLTTLFALASPALAHPLGLPAFARVAATGPHEVTVHWNAAPDDVVALVRSLGLEVPADGRLTAEQDAAISGSPQVRSALAEGIAVLQDGSPCAADVEVERLAAEGATVVFRCPSLVERIELRATILTDLDERYRTLAVVGTDAGAERWMLTASDPTRSFHLDRSRADEVLSTDPATASAPAAEDVAFGGSLPLEGRFVALIDATPTVATVALGLVVALGVGVLHGLAPGHGKAIAAAYLVGDRGRPRDAVLLGVVVASMHTGSVLLLGFALYGATRRPDTAALSAWLQVGSGATVGALGTWLLVRRWRRRPTAARLHEQAHRHGHADDPHHAHDHAHGHGHVHVLDEDVSPLSWPGLVALGAAGGVLPSPSALLVLFTALAVGRLGYGLSLIGAFSVGLAVTVAAVGLAAVWGRDLVVGTGRPWVAPLVRWAPVVAAGGVTILGLVLVLRGVAILA